MHFIVGGKVGHILYVLPVYGGRENWVKLYEPCTRPCLCVYIAYVCVYRQGLSQKGGPEAHALTYYHLNGYPFKRNNSLLDKGPLLKGKNLLLLSKFFPLRVDSIQGRLPYPGKQKESHKNCSPFCENFRTISE